MADIAATQFKELVSDALDYKSRFPIFEKINTSKICTSKNFKFKNERLGNCWCIWTHYCGTFSAIAYAITDLRLEDNFKRKFAILRLYQESFRKHDWQTDYNIVIEYTALPERFGCKICEEFHFDMGYIAKAANQGERKTYFLSLDFGGIQMQRAFQAMGIQNVPALVIVNGKVFLLKK